ncbi:hypothetical protein IVB18_11095 [Bradyrhizobium sp. 186]|uniref:hypothetical protein n=1 Tax=Bradyrhizobium sp. 186 TaxID=2782654 RepID=UPI0020010569|nr:hypothetical protein [Bradyrhizobium sp. 186]UPK37795.1 hypothetical protein IVB18_11095 [Bradyrhizobium sp. 186]
MNAAGFLQKRRKINDGDDYPAANTVWLQDRAPLAGWDVKQLALPGGRTAPVMGTNHPSYFFYAANMYTTGPDKDEKNFALGMEVMKQDIVAACWRGRQKDCKSLVDFSTRTIACERLDMT